MISATPKYQKKTPVERACRVKGSEFPLFGMEELHLRREIQRIHWLETRGFVRIPPCLTTI